MIIAAVATIRETKPAITREQSEADPAPGTFTCSACRGVFEKVRSDDEAMDEAEALWGTRADMAVVCDVCWREMMGLPPEET